jgi:hypothetical protein
MLRIVEFENGKYAVRHGLIFHKYRNRKNNYWWTGGENITDFCMFDTFEEAKQLAHKINLRVVRVLKTTEEPRHDHQ